MKKLFCVIVVSGVSANIASGNVNDSHSNNRQYTTQEIVTKYSNKYGLDEKLVWAVIGVESSGNPRALSPKDARGLMQVIPSTAQAMGVNPKYLYHPEHNVAAGTRYLAFLTKKFDNNLDLILAGYNAGEGAVMKYKGIPPYKETIDYVRKVKARYYNGNSAYARNSAKNTISVAQKENSLMVFSNWMGNEDKALLAKQPPIPEKVTKTVHMKDSKQAKKALPVVESIPEPVQPVQQVAQAEPTLPSKNSFVQTLNKDGNFIHL